MSDQSGVRVQERVIPFPKSISLEARSSLASVVGPDGVPFNLTEMPAPDDMDGWVKQKVTTAEYYSHYSSQLAEGLRSSVETIELGGVLVHVATPAGDAPRDRVYLDIHEGALVFGDGEPCRIGARVAADLHGVLCYSIDYRMPPEHPYPAALDDCVSVYRALLEQYAPENIIVGGGSAGGNLAAATVLRARDEGLPMPAAVVLMTPELDLTESGDTFETNQMIDVMLPRPLMNANLLYAAGHDLSHPHLSPLFGDFSEGFPPTLLQSGTRDLLLSNTVRMHRVLRRAGVPVELHIIEGMPHGGFMGSPEDKELAEEIGRFVAEHWGNRVHLSSTAANSIGTTNTGSIERRRSALDTSPTAGSLQRVPKSTPTDEILKIMAQDGAVIIEGFLSEDVVDAFKEEMTPYIAARAPGSTELLYTYEPGREAPEVDRGWGHNTVRLTRIIPRSETFRTKIITDDKLYELAKGQLASDHFWLSTAQVIYIGPGSLSQYLHRDNENYPKLAALGRAGPETICNSLIAITDFTDENGGTRVIPGSNNWDDYSERGADEDTIPVEMKKGDLLFFSGKVAHGGGANRTSDEWRFGLAVTFCAPYLMPEEAVPLMIDPDMAKTLPRNVQQMIGFRSMSMDNGARVWTADYESLAKHFGLEE